METLKLLEETNGKHVGYEINISCPNVKEGGMSFGVSPEMTEKLTHIMRKETKRLLIIKLSPNVTCIEDIAKASENGGADALSAINTVVGMSIDIQSRKPRLHTKLGGLSGPAIKPIAIANVHKVYNAVNIPVIGIGGVSNAQDVIEFMLAGASMVQVGTMNYQNPSLGSEIRKKLLKYFNDHNIDNANKLIGQVEEHSH